MSGPTEVVDAGQDAASAPDAFAAPDTHAVDAFVAPAEDAFIAADAALDAFPPDAFAPDAFTPPDAAAPGCPPLFRNPAVVPAGARALTLVQTLSSTRTGMDAMAAVPAHAGNVTDIAVNATSAAVTQWNGYALQYARDATSGRLTFVADRYLGDNTTQVSPRGAGGFLVTQAYRYPASVPLLRFYPSADFSAWTLGAFTTAGDDFGPGPFNAWGLVEAPSGTLYVGMLGRAESRGRDTRICRVDPSFPSLPDGADPTDAAGLGGDGAYLGLRAMEADDRYLYWVTGVTTSAGVPAQPHRVSRARFVGCGSSLAAHENVSVTSTPDISALAVHPDGRVFAGSPLGLSILDAAWTSASLPLALPLTRIVDMAFTPGGNLLIVTGTSGDFAAGTESPRILLIDTSTAVPTLLRTYGPGLPDGAFPEMARPGHIELYGGFVYIASYFASLADGSGTPNLHVFTWAP